MLSVSLSPASAGTVDQSLKKVLALRVAGRELNGGRKLPLRFIEEFARDNGGDRDCDPVFPGYLPTA
jgi:hypothetical protein